MFNLIKNKSEAEPLHRLVSAQTCKNGKNSAIYRMPGCNQSNINTNDWRPCVKTVCARASEVIGQDLNHALCILYRDEDDALCLHKDKLLDLEEGSSVVSMSFGETSEVGPRNLNEIIKQIFFDDQT